MSADPVAQESSFPTTSPPASEPVTAPAAASGMSPQFPPLENLGLGDPHSLPSLQGGMPMHPGVGPLPHAGFPMSDHIMPGHGPHYPMHHAPPHLPPGDLPGGPHGPHPGAPHAGPPGAPPPFGQFNAPPPFFGWGLDGFGHPQEPYPAASQPPPSMAGTHPLDLGVFDSTTSLLPTPNLDLLSSSGPSTDVSPALPGWLADMFNISAPSASTSAPDSTTASTTAPAGHGGSQSSAWTAPGDAPHRSVPSHAPPTSLGHMPPQAGFPPVGDPRMSYHPPYSQGHTFADPAIVGISSSVPTSRPAQGSVSSSPSPQIAVKAGVVGDKRSKGQSDVKQSDTSQRHQTGTSSGLSSQPLKRDTSKETEGLNWLRALLPNANISLVP